MDLEQRRIELENEIADIQSEIEVKLAELDVVRDLLNKESFEEAHEDELDDEDFVSDEEDENLDDDETDEDETDEEEDFEEDEELEDATEEDFEAELKEKESVLMEEVLVLQMKVAALTKQLNDILAQQGMNSLGESEE